MRNMFPMHERMTHRTKNHQIITDIIFSIPIYVMNAQNLFYFIVSTFFTSFNYSSSFPKRTERICFCGFCPKKHSIFIRTFFRTKFSFFARRIMENFQAKLTFFFRRSTVIDNSRTIIAFSRAIFSLLTSRRNMFKFFSAYLTKCLNLYSCMKTLAFSRTIFSSSQLIKRFVNFFKTVQTFYKFTSTRFIHATP